MRDTDELQVEVREAFGKRSARGLRNAGKLPAVLYGHGEQTINLSVPTDQIETALRHGTKLVELSGGASGRALIHELQWDTFSSHVLHVDFIRVEAGQRVTITVPVELRGSAPGEREGGVVEHLLHEVELEVDVSHIPDKLHVNINELQVDGSLTTADFEDMPAEARVVSDGSAMIVQCFVPAAPPEEEAAGIGEVEPQVIGRKEKEEAEDS